MIKRKKQVDAFDEYKKCKTDFTYFCRHYVKKPGGCGKCEWLEKCKVSKNKEGQSCRKPSMCEFGKMRMDPCIVYNPYEAWFFPSAH